MFVLDPKEDLTASIKRINRNNTHKRQYKDKQYEGGEVAWKKRVEISSTVYVGNLSCYTNELQIHELFSRCGSIRRIIMGLDKIKKTPCGFCFVEFDEREGALNSIDYLNRTLLDGRVITIDIDAGFVEGRQFGRGKDGGQVGDERRQQREQQMAQRGGYGGGGASGAGFIATRSITIVACLAIICLMTIEPITSAPQATNRYYPAYSSPLLFSNNNFRLAQLGQQREQFEKNFAQFLVNLMKAAKPTLLKAFIQATLADKQLKEIAIALFFNNTSTDNDD